MNYPPLSIRRHCAGFALLALLGLPVAESQAGNFTWSTGTGDWSVGANWGGTAPSGVDPTDVLQFGGSVATPYTATNNVANPFLLNQLVFSATDPTATGLTHFLAGSPLRFTGTNPQISADGTGGVRIDTPIQLAAPLTLTGAGTGVVTLNNTLSGTWDIVKSGTSIFRFGSQTIPGLPPTELPSANTWFGKLTIDQGTIRFNNNSKTGRTALRANPVMLTSAGSTLTVASELRTGTLSGNAGIVESQVTGTDTPNEDLIIHVIGDGSYGGTLRLGNSTGVGASDGELILRGPSTQTLMGSLQIRRDVLVGAGTNVVLAGTASLSDPLYNNGQGAIVLNGGSFKLDNTTVNNPNRLRDGTATSTGVDTIGGGSIVLIGNSAGTSETVGRVQLGSGSNLRSGNLNARVVHDSGTTILNFASYSRDGTTISHYTTMDFSAATSAGVPRTLGATGPGSRITFAGFTVPLSNSLVANSAGAFDSGWATVNGTDFATYSATANSGSELGIQAVVPTAFPSGTGGVSLNALLTTSGTISSATNFSLSSLKIAPAGPGLTLDISAGGNMNNRNFLLAGTTDFTIQNTLGSTSGITGGGTRYFHVEKAMLNVDVLLSNSTGASSAIVKAGSGFLSLLKNNSTVVAPVVLNGGTLRSSIANLPQGELRLRGGVYEISGGGTFSRPITFGAGGLTWAGIDSVTLTAIDQDRGSGGFSAFNGNVTLDLNTAGPTNIAWEDKGFLNSGHALIFNSVRADSMVTWSDNLSLTAVAQAVNYNAREIRVLDNPALASDFARISGVISGVVQDDLLKTGPGTLELTGANTYQGATQVYEGTLRINNTIATSFLTDVRSGGILAGNGTTGAVRLEIGGILAPGNAEGNASILNTGELRVAGAGATLSVGIGGTTPGGNGTTGYDQVAVSGAVVLDGATLAGALIGTFVPQAGDLFFIISNDGADPVVGQFAQGTFVSVGGFPFEIGYTGNWTGSVGTSTFLNGNDVVLRTIPEPTTAMLAAAGLCTLAMRRRRGTRS